jgi:hypothetical protein
LKDYLSQVKENFIGGGLKVFLQVYFLFPWDLDELLITKEATLLDSLFILEITNFCSFQGK